MTDPFGNVVGQLLKESSGSIPYNLPEESIFLESVRGLRTELDQVQADLLTIAADALTIAPHLISDASGLGPEHTVEGVAVKQVLRASGPDTANFQLLNFTDLEGTLANSQIDEPTSYTNLTRVGALIFGSIVQGFGQIDNRTNDVITRQLISNGAAAAISTTGSVTSELRLNVGTNDTFAAIFFRNRIDSADEVGGRINVNLVGVETVIINMKKDLLQFLTWDVNIDKSLTVTRDFAIVGSDLTNIPAFHFTSFNTQ